MPPRRQRQAKLDFASSKAADAATAVNKKRTRSPSKDDAIDLTKPQKKEPTLDTQPRSSPNATPSKSLKSSKAPIADSAKLSPVADADVTAVLTDVAADVESELKKFDLDYNFGPCCGLKRIDRWNRASRLGLEPPEHIRKLIEMSDREWPLWHDEDGRTPF